MINLINMNWLNRIFNWRKKAPKATNEMIPVDMSKYTVGMDRLDDNIPEEFLSFTWDCETEYFKLKTFIHNSYWKVKKSWKRSPKNYYVWISHSRGIELRRYSTSIHEADISVGNLYTLYQQYYGKESKSCKEENR